MAKFRVYGTAEVTVAIELEIDDEELVGLDEGDIEDYVLDRAYDEFGGIDNYVGNGGYDKLIGVRGSNESIEISSDVEFNAVEEV